MNSRLISIPDLEIDFISAQGRPMKIYVFTDGYENGVI